MKAELLMREFHHFHDVQTAVHFTNDFTGSLSKIPFTISSGRWSDILRRMFQFLGFKRARDK